ncbi:MAG: twin transmembrane helix small protein [Hyphomonas sp.]
MAQFLVFLFYAALVGLLIVLGLGLANLARTDENQPSRSNKLMRMRIFIQAVAIVLLVLLGFLSGAIRF